MERQIQVVYQDDDLLVLNKPPGWVTAKERVGEKNPTVEEWLFSRVGKALPRNGIVHRLDKGTSGLLVVGKNNECLEVLKSFFKKRQVKKRYLAVAGGDVSFEGTVEVPIGRTVFGKFGVKVGGKMSRSEFSLLKKYKKDSKIYSLVEVNLKTGRTHQIRVHFSYLGWPLLGDVTYGGEKIAIDRPFLHAYKVKFKHPRSGKDLVFELKLSEDLRRILEDYEEI